MKDAQASEKIRRHTDAIIERMPYNVWLCSAEAARLCGEPTNVSAVSKRLSQRDGIERRQELSRGHSVTYFRKVRK